MIVENAGDVALGVVAVLRITIGGGDGGVGKIVDLVKWAPGVVAVLNLLVVGVDELREAIAIVVSSLWIS